MPKASSFSRFTRGVRHTVRAFASTKHPVLVHIVPMRRCNLSCTYCNEYDKTSDPVPIETMLERIDKLADSSPRNDRGVNIERLLFPARES